MSLLPLPLKKTQRDTEKSACPHQGRKHVCPSHHQVPQEHTVCIHELFFCCKTSGEMLLCEHWGEPCQETIFPEWRKELAAHLITSDPQ